MYQGSIDRFLKRKSPCDGDEFGSSSNIPQPNPTTTNNTPSTSIPIKIDINDLPWDPSDRPRILEYDANQRDEIRRLYLDRGPCQPKGHKFPTRTLSKRKRSFIVTWFTEFHWLEYSVKADKAYCMCCYLFRDYIGNQGGNDAFVTKGFDSWSKKKSFYQHEGNVNSYHNKAVQKCELLMKKNQFISAVLNKQTEAKKNAYFIRLTTSIQAARFLVKNALPFRGHDESSGSLSRGLFIEMLGFAREVNESLGEYILEKAPQNNTLTSSDIQKDIIKCFSKVIVNSICEEIGDDAFALLVDESCDVSRKEQMAVVLRYVDKSGLVKERFVGVVHVMDTSASTLKSGIESLLTKHKLSFTQIRGQGYDGASNMRGEFNGLKALILRDNDSAYYVHCFAHRLQLVVVAVAKKHKGVESFFDILSNMTNVVSSSCKRKDMMRESYKERLQKQIKDGEIETGKGLNQEISLTRAGDTRWSSHDKTIIGLKNLFPEVIKVLKYVEEDGTSISNRSQATGLLSCLKKFDFVFYMHLISHIFGLTDVLSRHLQKKDQNILEAVSLVKAIKRGLQTFRENGFDSCLEEVKHFCQKHGLQMVEMADYYSKNRRSDITNQHHFEVDIFNTVLDMQIQEFGDRFSDVSTELLENMVALSPCVSFAKFDSAKIIKFSQMYPNDFSVTERFYLPDRLEIYYQSVHNDENFANLSGIADFARVMVETGKHLSFPTIYRLLKLALVLPVATATVERCFSKMKIVKSDLRNRMGDDFLNDLLVCAIEKEALASVKNQTIIDRFQTMKKRRGQ